MYARNACFIFIGSFCICVDKFPKIMLKNRLELKPGLNKSLNESSKHVTVTRCEICFCSAMECYIFAKQNKYKFYQ